MDHEQMEEEFSILKHGNLEGFPHAFTDIRARMKNKTGQPVLFVDRNADASKGDGFPMHLGILKSERLFCRKPWSVCTSYSLAFHTGQVAWTWFHMWEDAPGEKEGPLTLHDIDVIGLIMHRAGKTEGSSPPPTILIGNDEIEAWAERFYEGQDEGLKRAFYRALAKLDKIASISDPDEFGRSREREKLLTRMIDVNELWEPTFGCDPDEIDNPKYRKIVGEMSLCIRRAAQLAYPHALVEKFKHYLAP